MPELNDNFVKELNIEVETLSDLKERLEKKGKRLLKIGKNNLSSTIFYQKYPIMLK